MSSQPSRNTSPAKASLSLLATGSMSLGIAFVLWLGFLALNGISFFFQASSHQKGYHSFSLLGSDFGIASCYATSFLLGAFIVARQRWSYRPSLSAFVAYGCFLVMYFPFIDWSRGFSSDTASIIAPLITAPIGGFLGKHLFAKTQSA